MRLQVLRDAAAAPESRPGAAIEGLLRIPDSGFGPSGDDCGKALASAGRVSGFSQTVSGVVSQKFVELLGSALLCRVPCSHGEAAMRGRPTAEPVLTEPEREELVALALRRKTAQALALRARIVLACADGQASKAVAARQRVTPQTVGK